MLGQTWIRRMVCSKLRIYSRREVLSCIASRRISPTTVSAGMGEADMQFLQRNAPAKAAMDHRPFSTRSRYEVLTNR